MVLTSQQVDINAVGEALGYKNARSVTNKLATLRKKYDLPLGGSAGVKATGSTEAKTPATPSKNRVTKPGAAATKRKISTPKTPKTPKNVEGKKAKPAVKDENKENGHDSNDNMESDEELVVQSPITDDEAVFGKKDTDDEASDKEA